MFVVLFNFRKKNNKKTQKKQVLVIDFSRLSWR